MNNDPQRLEELIEKLHAYADQGLARSWLIRDAATSLTNLAAALRPFAVRAEHLTDDTPDEFTAWHPAVGSPVSAGDLRAAVAAIPTMIHSGEVCAAREDDFTPTSNDEGYEI